MFGKNKSKSVITWNDLVTSYRANPRDIKTVPKKGSGRWFYVYVVKENIYIESARSHSVSSNITVRRTLESHKVGEMLSLYLRRKNGDSVSQEATATTQNQVYWYGIFADMGI